jgi:hypothetical protein
MRAKRVQGRLWEAKRKRKEALRNWSVGREIGVVDFGARLVDGALQLAGWW